MAQDPNLHYQRARSGRRLDEGVVWEQTQAGRHQQPVRLDALLAARKFQRPWSLATDQESPRVYGTSEMTDTTWTTTATPST